MKKNNSIKNVKKALLEPEALLNILEDLEKEKQKLKISESEVTKLNKQLLLKAEESQHKYKTIYDSSFDAIMILEPPTWNFTAGNPATLKLLNIKTQKEFTTLGPGDISPEKQPDGQLSSEVAKKRIAKAMKEGSNFFEWSHKKITGEIFPATVLLTRMKLGKKDVLQATVRDITEQKEYEDKLNRANQRLKKSYEELKTLDEMKGKFLIVTSHELKTPITPLMIQAQMLMEGELGKLTPEQKESAEIIHRNMKRLNALISDILDVSKITSEILKLDLRKGDLNEVILKVINEQKVIAKQKELNLQFKKVSLPKISFDSERIHQVLLNLISNAIKFTKKKGTILVETKLKKDSVLINVRDNGSGIKKEDLENVFNPFFQSKPSYLEKHRGGTGLGLTIARGIITGHGGKIWLKSTFGKGTAFSFTIPLVKIELDKTENLNKSNSLI